MPHKTSFFYRSLLFAFMLFAPRTPYLAAQTDAADLTPCGIVDGIDYPIDIADSLREGYDDFALLRPRFGGNHVGIDIGFNRRGEPVLAAARGRVTYADVNGWDTEKGVVIIQHRFPDDSVRYTLYGHMEIGDGVAFPVVGDCIERGSIVGLIGWPSRGLPHLHYEIRDFLPNDGGPGYVINNPLDEGWFHPLDFTELWRMRLSPAVLDTTTFTQVPSLPPILLENGGSVIASGEMLMAFDAAGALLWNINADGVITGIAGLPGDRVIAHTRNGQALTLQNGRYNAVWNVPGPEAPLRTLGDTTVFVTDGGGIAAYNPMGEALWAIPVGDAPPETQPESTPAETPANMFGMPTDAEPRLRITLFEANDSQIAVAARENVSDGGRAITWRLFNSGGAQVYQADFETTPATAALPSGGWLALDGATLYRIHDGARTTLATLPSIAGRNARMITDLVGNVTVYLGDRDGTLLSIDPVGEIRWRAQHPFLENAIAPLIDIGGGCIFYLLDGRGTLFAFNASNGELIGEMTLYAGGVQNGSPRSRLLSADANDTVTFGSGFLSTARIDGRVLGASAMETCLLG